MTISDGIFPAGCTEITLAFIGAAVLFLPLFVFLRVHQDLKEVKNA
ncbi:MAG: hypothetical protein M0R30_02200 [Methanoregula sp.]|nr:hypothetical protein [Methanoregula sp.]MCK9630428.1 hypothetical protein [Methanoregula sp.]